MLSEVLSFWTTEAAMGALSTLAGTLIGLGGGAFFQRRSEVTAERREARLLRITKTEEIVAILEKLRRDYRIANVSWQDAMATGNLDRIAADLSPMAAGEIVYFRALIAIYFPSLTQIVERFESDRIILYGNLRGALSRPEQGYEALKKEAVEILENMLELNEEFASDMETALMLAVSPLLRLKSIPHPKDPPADGL